MGFGTDTIDETQDHTVLEITHPVTIQTLRRATFKPGVYRFQGDLRGCFRNVKERRLLVAGVVKLSFQRRTQSMTVSAWTQTPMTHQVVEPRSIDLTSATPDTPKDASAAAADGVSPVPAAPPTELPMTEPERAVAEETPVEPILLRRGTLESTVVKPPKPPAVPEPQPEIPESTVVHPEPPAKPEVQEPEPPAEEEPVVATVIPEPVEVPQTDVVDDIFAPDPELPIEPAAAVATEPKPKPKPKPKATTSAAPRRKRRRKSGDTPAS